MSRNFKIFLIILTSSVLWWGVNVFAQKLGDFFYTKEMAKSNDILSHNYEAELEARKPLVVPGIDDPEITARSTISILVKANGQEKILFEKNIDEKLPIASVTKLMTATVTLDNYNLSDITEISSKVGEIENEYGSGNLKVSEKFSVESLLYFLLIESNNGSAFALAEMIGEQNFVDLMNLKAVDLGLNNTFFINSSGLDPDNPKDLTNYSTVKDISRLATYILNNKSLIWSIANKKSFDVYAIDGALFRQLKNTNELLDTVPNLVGKTGWTPRAGGCLVVVYRSPDRSGHLVNVVLSSEDRFGDMTKLIDWLKIAYKW